MICPRHQAQIELGDYDATKKPGIFFTETFHDYGAHVIFLKLK